MLLAAVVVTLVVVAAAPAATLTEQERSVVAAINDVRERRGLSALRVDVRLTRAARTNSRHVLWRDVLTHGDFRRRIAASGAVGPRFGENLAWGIRRHATPRSIVRGWLRSPEHRANLLRRGTVRLGIGRSVGNFRGFARATIVTATFAGR